jgi:hypothetical protein
MEKKDFSNIFDYDKKKKDFNNIFDYDKISILINPLT